MGWWKQTIPTLLAEALDDNSDTRTPIVLVVGHGAFLRALIEALVDAGFSASCLATGKRLGSIANTGVTTINVYDEFYGDIVTYADIAHLQALLNQNPEDIVKESSDDLEARKMSEGDR
jgi:broad specificity phosphatase PhoE